MCGCADHIGMGNERPAEYPDKDTDAIIDK